MVIFTKYKAVAALVLAVTLAAVPVMVDHKPGAVLAGLSGWLPVLYTVAALLLAYTLMTVSFHLGVKAGSQKAIAIAAPVEPADPQGRTISDLIYSVGALTNILLEEGDLRDGAARSQMARLERQHRAWHGPFQLQARDAFLASARRAMKSRHKQSAWAMSYGDFPPGQREVFQQELTAHRNSLLLVLQALQFVTPGDNGDGPELIEAD